MDRKKRAERAEALIFIALLAVFSIIFGLMLVLIQDYQGLDSSFWLQVSSILEEQGQTEKAQAARDIAAILEEDVQ